jgi:hypothetical protein
MIAALTDLRPNIRLRNRFPEMLKRQPPAFRMHVNRIKQRAVNIEQNRSLHLASILIVI